MAPGPSIGIVLSGGGARGAYEAGVLWGICEAVHGPRCDRPLFDVVTGTSVGAINGAWVAANAHKPGHDAPGLGAVWRSMLLAQHLRVDLQGLLLGRGVLRFLGRSRRKLDDYFGKSLLDPSALERLIVASVDWRQMAKNIDAGLVHAFVVAALHIGTGTTTLFADLQPGRAFRPSKNPRRIARQERVTAEHILASAAIPGLFPARRIGRTFFVDGGLRFNTPIAPAIRAGADKLVVLTLQHEVAQTRDVEAAGHATEQYPNVAFLLGKLLNALLQDPVSYDLQVLQRFNALLGVLEETLAPDEHARLDAVLETSRGMAYRRIETLHFEPSKNLGVLAGEHLREHLTKWELGGLYEWLLAKAANVQATWEADLASYVLFDGSYAEKLMELGRHDAQAKRDEIRAFFEA